jgi:hypothetical protein
MLRFVRYIVAAGLAAAATAASAAALPPEIIDGVMNACRPDLPRVCTNVAPGDKRAGRCLLDHERDLSPPCLRAVRFAYALEVCLPDYRQFCGGVPQGPQAVECLAARMGSLGEECKRAVSMSTLRTARDDYPYGDSPYQGDRYGYSAPPVPYSAPREDGAGYGAPPSPRPEQYGYNAPPRPYAGPTDDGYGYNPPPGRSEDGRGYGPPQGPRDDRYGYEAPSGPYSAPNPDAYAYRRNPSPDADRYADEGDRRDGTNDGRYADREYDRPRHQPYGSGAPYNDGQYQDRGYFGERGPYEPEEERGPPPR